MTTAALTASKSRMSAERSARAATSQQEAEYDAELVRRFNAGDEPAFVEIMNRYREKIFSVALALSDDSDATFADLVATDAPSPAREAATGEFSALVTECMEKLDARHREILTLRNLLNRSYDEIAQALGINVGTVKSRIARARGNLRALLAEACPEFAPDATPSDWFEPNRATGRLEVAAA